MNLSCLKWSLKLQWVCMGRSLGPEGPGNIYIKYIESSKLKTVQFFLKWNIPLNTKLELN